MRIKIRNTFFNLCLSLQHMQIRLCVCSSVGNMTSCCVLMLSISPRPYVLGFTMGGYAFQQQRQHCSSQREHRPPVGKLWNEQQNCVVRK